MKLWTCEKNGWQNRHLTHFLKIPTNILERPHLRAAEGAEQDLGRPLAAADQQDDQCQGYGEDQKKDQDQAWSDH